MGNLALVQRQGVDDLTVDVDNLEGHLRIGLGRVEFEQPERAIFAVDEQSFSLGFGSVCVGQPGTIEGGRCR